MKIRELKSMIENNYLDDDAEIMFSGVRNGVKHHGYEVWSTEDSLGRESMHISIATEGDNDYAVVERDINGTLATLKQKLTEEFKPLLMMVRPKKKPMHQYQRN